MIHLTPARTDPYAADDAYVRASSAVRLSGRILALAHFRSRPQRSSPFELTPSPTVLSSAQLVIWWNPAKRVALCDNTQASRSARGFLCWAGALVLARRNVPPAEEGIHAETPVLHVHQKVVANIAGRRE